MSNVTKEEIKRAKEMDLLTYLKTREPMELIKERGENYTTRTHDSLKISHGMWMWFSRGIGGRSALDYLIKVRDMDFVSAVKKINGELNIEKHIQKGKIFKEKEEETYKEEEKLFLPERNNDNRQAYKYLYKRGISTKVIREMIKEGYLYESLPYHSVNFVTYDKGIPRYACYRGTGEKKILGESRGSDKSYGFVVYGKEKDNGNLHVFESAIDMLSYMTLISDLGGDYRKENYLSLGGVTGSLEVNNVPRSILRVMRNVDLERIYLHLDNDEPGRKGTERISNGLKDYELEVIDSPSPREKDFNDYLMDIRNDRIMKSEVMNYER